MHNLEFSNDSAHGKIPMSATNRVDRVVDVNGVEVVDVAKLEADVAIIVISSIE